MMQRIPNREQEERVVRKIYSEALHMDWEHRSDQEHTEQYGKWLDDPEVGGVLEGYGWLRDQQRVWLKDVPMKEFARARAGKGPFAKLLPEHPTSAEVIVREALGPSWDVKPGSKQTKPLNCIAESGTEEIKLFWGPNRDLRHLLWAAFVYWSKTDTDKLMIVVHDTVEAPLSAEDRAFLKRLAGRIGMCTRVVRVKSSASVAIGAEEQ